MEKLADIGIIGLAVMGENLALNLLKNNWTVAVYNRTTQKTINFSETRAQKYAVLPTESIEQFCQKLATPRKMILMVKAGEAVDACINKLLPHLEKDDIIIDGGNSHYFDTQRRCETLKKQGINFVGCGISGGEEGALNGAAMMLGCQIDVWEKIKPILTTAAAYDFASGRCCARMGNDGAGHFVKMVHNGIEYADMQLIAEAYAMLKATDALTNTQIAEIFEELNQSEVASYLIEITAKILREKEPDGRSLILDHILDVAGQKGTGKWTSLAAMDYMVSIPSIAEAVYARSLSKNKEERIKLSTLYHTQVQPISYPKNLIIQYLKSALLCAKLTIYTQGFNLLERASKEFNWQLNLSEVTRIWQGGCIIRAQFLSPISEGFAHGEPLQSPLEMPYILKHLQEHQAPWREWVALGIKHRIALPAFSSALAWFDGMTCAELPANLIQAQRDFFGAHTFERTDSPRGLFFHHDWTHLGGKTASTTYNA